MLDEVEPVYTSITAAISQFQPVLVLCLNPAMTESILQHLDKTGQANMSQIHTLVCPTNDTWARDYAAITVIENQKPKLLDFTFNGWGNKFSHQADNMITQHLNQCGVFTSPMKPVPFILEGGSIESDGQGSLLTTTHCLLSQNRNATLNQAEIETQLKNHLYINHVLWLEHGMLLGDDTDGHIDNLARFTSPNDIAYLACTDHSDEHYGPLQAMANQLSQFKNEAGAPFQLHPIPLPSAVYGRQQQRLAASYLNFLIINDAVLVPTFGVKEDQIALDRLKSLFEPRKIIGIDCLALLEQNGGLHCSTMQFPENTIATQFIQK